MSPENEKQEFDLHLPGLLKVLAEHLYSTQQVGLRELLQKEKRVQGRFRSLTFGSPPVIMHDKTGKRNKNGGWRTEIM